MVECEICHREPVNDGVQLLRVNEFGVKGIWRCRECITSEQFAAHDIDMLLILDIIEADNKSR